ncbi:NAD(P)-dependent oxidoreductase [Streptosporangium lutulentum]|uniref:3-hydroxyisobutyrate dehydrogenase-like beta-hydroxyacid dehydrogenase n=1 Tax=Streptosporangium lutulentum TaxID=1461250 RepID=A0ABT9Q298_9ACTN|nr:NAD(P)-dependent oxidoreductase [Streptosporangium lutulentum]MDP9840853.1 3-hydroxyisobutyrate dehydrogenase-like beta-hydroxyacid dehydrogenase [Streptosporangium lutulentum]
MRVSVLGMGSMGRALALRLLERGHVVTIWNRTPGKAAEVVDAGAVEASSPIEAARGTEAVLMSLADDRAVRDVMTRLADLGSDPGGPIVADMSTVSPDTSRALVDLVPGGRFVAAPILGGPQAVVEGQAMGLLGGERDLVDRLKPIWPDLFATRWYYCGGDPGNALTYKLLNNYLMMSGIAVIAEVVATGQAAGLDEAMLREFLFQWPTVAPALHNRLDGILGDDHRGWFTTSLGAKDVRLTVEVAESRGIDLPIARLVERRYEEAAERGWSDSDITAVVELLRDRRR